MPAGYPVLLITGAATRDPRAFENADDFDIERPPNVAIGFGHGVHSCLGAALARMESRIAIEEIAARWSRLEVDESGLAAGPHVERRRLLQRARPRHPLTGGPPGHSVAPGRSLQACSAVALSASPLAKP